MADARLMNKPVPFEFGGTVYNVTPEPDFAVEAAYQNWLEREAYLALYRHKATFGESDYRDQLKGYRHDLAAKEYAYGGEVAFRSLRTEPGWKEMAWLLFKHAENAVGQPEPVTRELVERIARDPEKAQELIALVWGVQDPNPKRPAATNPPAGV